MCPGMHPASRVLPGNYNPGPINATLCLHLPVYQTGYHTCCFFHAFGGENFSIAFMMAPQKKKLIIYPL